MKENQIFYLRKFINKKGFHSNAFIFGEITKSVSKTKRGKESVWRDCELKISDCDRIVSLSMDLHSIAIANNSIYKLDVLIESLKEFRTAFVHEVNSMKKKK